MRTSQQGYRLLGAYPVREQSPPSRSNTAEELHDFAMNHGCDSNEAAATASATARTARDDFEPASEFAIQANWNGHLFEKGFSLEKDR